MPGCWPIGREDRVPWGWRRRQAAVRRILGHHGGCSQRLPSPRNEEVRHVGETQHHKASDRLHRKHERLSAVMSLSCQCSVTLGVWVGGGEGALLPSPFPGFEISRATSLSPFPQVKNLSILHPFSFPHRKPSKTPPFLPGVCSRMTLLLLDILGSR